MHVTFITEAFQSHIRVKSIAASLYMKLELHHEIMNLSILELGTNRSLIHGGTIPHDCDFIMEPPLHASVESILTPPDPIQYSRMVMLFVSKGCQL